MNHCNRDSVVSASMFLAVGVMSLVGMIGIFLIAQLLILCLFLSYYYVPSDGIVGIVVADSVCRMSVQDVCYEVECDGLHLPHYNT